MKKRHSKSGFTLIELLVAIGLFTIIIAIAVGGFTSALRTQRQVSSLISTQSNASLALEQMTREIRTGYLFCHRIGSISPLNSCNCTIGDSGYSPAAAGYPTPANPSELLSDGDLPVWNCGALDFFTSDGTEVRYQAQGAQESGVLRNENGGTYESITGNNVYVHTLDFVLFGNIEGDNWTPRITIEIAVSPNSTDPATTADVLNLQTTVSARQIDCTINSSSPQC